MRPGALACVCLGLGACLAAPRRVPAEPESPVQPSPVVRAERVAAGERAPASVEEAPRVPDRVTVGELELQVSNGPRPVRASEEPAQDRVDAQGAIEVAHRALGDGAVHCTAALQTFDTGRRWNVECEGDRTVWVDAHTGDAELVGSAAVRSP